MTNDQNPVPAVAVSPVDQSPDRTQSDTDQAGNLERNLDDRTQSDANQLSNDAKLDEILAHQSAFAISPEDQSSDRLAADANQAVNIEKLDRLIEVSDALSLAATSVSDSTAAELRAATAQRGRFMKVMAAMAVTTAILLGANFTIGLQGAAQRREILQKVTDISASTSKDAVARVGQVVVLAATCAPDYVQLPLTARQKAIEACIVAHLPK